MTPEQVVAECEALLKSHNMAGIIVAMNEENGYYSLRLSKESLFEWNDDDTKVRLSLAEASKTQVEDEFHTLEVLQNMMSHCGRAIDALVDLLYDAVKPAGAKKDKNYDN